MSSPTTAVAIEPSCPAVLLAAVEAAGGHRSHLVSAEVLVWTAGADEFPSLPSTVRWVALPTAGIEAFYAAGVLDIHRQWTNASGFYAENVAEHALALLLAGLRQIPAAARNGWDKDGIDPNIRRLRGSTVAIVGAGGIARALIPRLTACGAQTIAINRSGRPVDGAIETLPVSQLAQVWPRVDHVVLAAPATAETHHLISAAVLAAMPSHAWIVNVARGPLIDQAALIGAVRAGSIAGAALDVTDPEPPAPDDPILHEPAILVTPHVANPASGLLAELAPWIGENLRRYRAGDPLLATVSADRDY